MNARLDSASSVFDNDCKNQKEALKYKLKEDRLFKQIGQLQVEVNFLKDSCDKLGVSVPEDRIC